MTSLPPGAIAQSGFARGVTPPVKFDNSSYRSNVLPDYEIVGITTVIMGQVGLSRVAISGKVSGDEFHIIGIY